MRGLLSILLLLAGGPGLVARAQTKTAAVLQVPGRREFCRVDEKGRSVLPSGRYVTPAGQLVRITHDPFGLALRTPYWKNMLVIVTEDDPQGGVDHVDAHRSILMLAGPYVKKGYVSHAHANFGAVLKTIYNLLGVPYVNQYDATGTLLQDFFTSTPDFRPYTLERSDPRIFDPQQALRRYDKTIDWRQVEKGPDMDDEARERADHYRQQKNQ